jgi:ADP-ribose pyrophosphatase
MPKHVLAQGRYLRLVEEEGWEFTERVGSSGVVVIVALTKHEEIVLVEQHRPPLKCRVLELPAGLVGDKDAFRDEAFETAALRELEEETGFRASAMRCLTNGPSAAGSSNTLIQFYLATGLEKTGEGGGDEHEDIQVHVVPLGEAARFASAKESEGILVDPKFYAGLYFAGVHVKGTSDAA